MQRSGMPLHTIVAKIPHSIDPAPATPDTTAEEHTLGTMVDQRNANGQRMTVLSERRSTLVQQTTDRP